MSGCCVNGCTNRYSTGGLKFYRIPTGSRPFQSNRRRLWLQAIKREDWNENIIKNARVCSAHFISGERSLNFSSPDFVPSVFTYTKQSQNPGVKMDRYHTKRKRDDRPGTAANQRVPSETPEQECSMDHCPGSTGDLFMEALDTSVIKEDIIEVTVGETGARDPNASESPSTTHSIEGRYSERPWKLATVEAITDLGSLDTTDTGTQIAQNEIANLKDENDYLRVQNVNLRSELRAMQCEHELQLRDLQERLEVVRQRCSCGAMSETTDSEVASVATDGDGC
ncbi:hypothetical protein AALO_G00268550 [Alosa alosa]|uniref:THAP domain-containing protein 1 n=1 Tax=Alosa alosa TaxID=278164 RepID=A0AAV6FTV0_9TELE|nr:hypothetical protein AALO_G00268550 [Alosa alosa]